MNFYICSTVRHLLFALLKAVSETSQTHHILFFSDFQDTSLDGWDLAHLPGNIHVYEGNRRAFRSRLTRNLRGKIFYFLAMRNLKAPGSLEQAFFATLDDLHPEIAPLYRNESGRKLWLFNERNKMARAFRLVTQKFYLIEEGSGNYHYFKKPWWRWPGRALLGRPFNRLSFGEDFRCKQVLVSYPDKLPPFVRHKGAQIEFLNTPGSKQQVAKICGAGIDFAALARSVIIATSPLDTIDRISLENKLELYRTMVETVEGLGLEATLKFHPRENPDDYAKLSRSISTAPEKIPLEVIIILSEQPVTILSFFTSAGIGLEPYFRMIELCGRSDSEGYDLAKLHEWLEHPDRLRALITSRLSEAT